MYLLCADPAPRAQDISCGGTALHAIPIGRRRKRSARHECATTRPGMGAWVSISSSGKCLREQPMLRGVDPPSDPYPGDVNRRVEEVVASDPNPDYPRRLHHGLRPLLLSKRTNMSRAYPSKIRKRTLRRLRPWEPMAPCLPIRQRRGTDRRHEVLQPHHGPLRRHSRSSSEDIPPVRVHNRAALPPRIPGDASHI